MDNNFKIPESFRYAYEIQVDDILKWIGFVAYVNWGMRKSKCGECTMPTWVYRGQSDASWDLKSGFERAISIDHFKEDELRFKERQSINQYRSSSPSIKGLSDPELLTYMQHYGVKTRLLDFTYLPLVALYFAVQDNMNNNGRGNNDFAVWMISLNAPGGKYDKEALFKKLLETVKDYEGRVSEIPKRIHSHDLDSTPFNNRKRICEDRELLRQVLTEGTEDSSWDVVTMLAYDVINKNERLRAQDGLFLVPTKLTMTFMDSFYEWQGLEKKEFIKEELPISELFNGEGIVKDEVATGVAFKFVFPAKLREKARSCLNIANVRPSVLFPDPEGVAKEVNLNMMTIN